MFLYYGVAHGEAQAHPFLGPEVLRGEIGIEDLRKMFFGDALARIRDGQLDVVTCRQDHSRLGLKRPVPCGDGKGTTVLGHPHGHSDQRWMTADLRLIGLDRPYVFLKLYLHFTREPDRDIIETSRMMAEIGLLEGTSPFENVRS